MGKKTFAGRKLRLWGDELSLNLIFLVVVEYAITIPVLIF